MNTQLIVAMVVAAGCSIAIVFAWILLMISGENMSYAKAYGQRKQQVCGKEFLERETARYEVDLAYTSQVGTFIGISMTTLFTVCMVPLIIASGVLMTFFKANIKNGEIHWKKIAYITGSVLTVLSVLTVYLLFFVKEVSNAPISKYVHQMNEPFEKNTTMRRTKIITIAVSIVLALWIAVIAYKNVHTDNGILPEKLDDYQQIATVFTVIVGAAALIIIIMDNDNQLLKSNIDGKYGVIKNDLQKNVLKLIAYPDFVKYLQINIKRSHSDIDGNPDVNAEPYLDHLYGYLEHRPGNNKPIHIDFKYVSLEGIKDIIEPFMDGVGTNITDRHLLLEFAWDLITKETIDYDYLFEKEDIQEWLSHKYLFSGKEVSIVQPIMNLINETSTNTNNTGVTFGTLATVLSNVLMSSEPPSMNNNNRPSRCVPGNRSTLCRDDIIGYRNSLPANAASIGASTTPITSTTQNTNTTPITSTTTSTTPSTTQTTSTTQSTSSASTSSASTSASTSSASTSASNPNLTLTSEEKTKIEYALGWFIFFSTYKNDTLYSFDTIYAKLDANKVIHIDTLANMRAALKELEENVGVNTGTHAINKLLSEARSIENDVVGAVDTFLSHINVVTVGVLGIAVYAIMHYLYQAYPSQLVTVVGIMVLMGVFAVTWYAWFFAKLKL